LSAAVADGGTQGKEHRSENGGLDRGSCRGPPANCERSRRTAKGKGLYIISPWSHAINESSPPPSSPAAVIEEEEELLFFPTPSFIATTREE